MAYPLQIEIDYQEKRSRLTTFLRILLVIPHIIALAVLEFVAFFAVIVAWFALLFTARWPQGIYDFVFGVYQYYARVYGYLYLLVDPYPRFTIEADPSYPVRVLMTPPDQYSRLKVLLRILYVIPAYIIAYVIGLVLSVVIFVDWIVIVILGRQPEGLQDVSRFCFTYLVRVQALFILITETYPPFSETA